MNQRKSSIHVSIDTDRCEGHGRCYALAPSVFAADEEGRGCVIVADLDDPNLVAAAELGARNCPESVISITSLPA